MSHKLFRIMIRGEDNSLWCETNNKTREWCEENGDRLCSKYENARWFIEQEESTISLFNPLIDYDEDYYDEEY